MPATNFDDVVGGVLAVPIVLPGTTAALRLGIARFKAPFKCDVVAVYAGCRAFTGAAPTVDVKKGGTSVLSATITLAAAATTKGTLGTVANSQNIAAETEFTVDLTTVGTNVDDVAVTVFLRRTGD